MTEQDALNEISRILGEIAQAKGVELPTINRDTILLGGDIPIDSLDLAGIVVQMESAAGHDPFSAGFTEFRTVGELASLYAQ